VSAEELVINFFFSSCLFSFSLIPVRACASCPDMSGRE
jgi:hypothetical protein